MYVDTTAGAQPDGGGGGCGGGGRGASLEPAAALSATALDHIRSLADATARAHAAHAAHAPLVAPTQHARALSGPESARITSGLAAIFNNAPPGARNPEPAPSEAAEAMLHPLVASRFTTVSAPCVDAVGALDIEFYRIAGPGSDTMLSIALSVDVFSILNTTAQYLTSGIHVFADTSPPS
jgi:hypothetical protein